MDLIEESLNEVFYDAGRRKIFWHNDMPIDYKTHKVFQGLNFLILGTHPKTLLDPRWGSALEYQNIHVEPKAEIVNILYWHDNYCNCTLKALPMINASDTDDYSVIEYERTNLQLIDFLELYHIPFQISENNINSYSQMDNTLYINADIDDLQKELALKKAFPAIARYITNNTEWQNDYEVKNLDPQTKPYFMILLEDLVMYKLAYKLGIPIKGCMNLDLMCDAIKYFEHNKKISLFLSIFLIADRVCEKFFVKKEKHNEILLDYMVQDCAYKLVRTVSYQELIQIQNNMQDAKNAKDTNTCYLHFYANDEEGCIDYYVTGYDEDNFEAPIKGIRIIDDYDPEIIEYAIDDLSADYSIDPLFIKVPTEIILKQHGRTL